MHKVFKLIYIESNISKLDVKSEIEKAKKNIMKELGIENEDSLFQDIDNELKEVDLSSITFFNFFRNY